MCESISNGEWLIFFSMLPFNFMIAFLFWEMKGK